MKNVGRIALIAILTLLVATVASAATVLVSWNPNTEEDLAGYRLYVGTASGQYGEPVDVGNLTEHTMQIAPQYGTTYYFAVTAYDTSGNESGYSDEASLFIQDGVPPAKPKGLIARIVDAVISWFRGLFGLSTRTV